MGIQHLDKLDMLNLGLDEYVILGSAAAMAHGYPKETNEDIDIFICQSAFDTIADRLSPIEKAGHTMYVDKSGCLDIDTSVEVFRADLSEVFRMSCVIDGHRYLDMEGLLRFYTHLYEGYGMEKHKMILDWINVIIGDNRGCYSDIIENLPGILHHGDNMLVVLSSGPRMVNYLGDRALCISGISSEEQATLFEIIERETEFRVTNWIDGLGIYVPEHCTDIGAVVAITDAGRQLLSNIKKI